MTTTYLIALSNGLATLPDQKCKYCPNPTYEDSEYCYPHMLADERVNE